MTAVAAQPKRTTRQRRIIERPRLIRRLEAINARTILLVAPAGYGKTTLARQWGRSLSQVIWVSATRSHRDVVTFSEDIAHGVDALGGEAASFIDQYMRARPNPQRAAREIANALAPRIERAQVQWLVLDDYHELAESPEVEEMVRVLWERLTCRFLVASRVQPEWATGRGVVHGEVEEIGADELALTPEETTQVLGKRPDLASLIEQAKGWPAVVTLAAGLDEAERDDAIPSMLHRYVAEELFRSATEELRDALISLALLPDLSLARVTRRFGVAAQDVIHNSRDLGFLGGDEQLELHPLLREFLLVKLSEKPDANARVRDAVDEALDARAWGITFELVLRFDLEDLIDPILQRAFKPLVRSGRVGTLAAFSDRIRRRPGFPPPAIEVVEAEVALRDGQFELAADTGTRALSKVDSKHVLASRLNAVAGWSRFFLAEFADAEASFNAAAKSAQDEPDETDAIFGIATTRIFGERGDPAEVMAVLEQRRHISPEHLLRFSAADLSLRRWYAGLSGQLRLETARRALEQATDPRARTSFTYTAANLLGQRGSYPEALEYLELFSRDADTYELAFVRPYVHWTRAFIKLGLRRFGEAERSLQLVDAEVEKRQHPIHELNARMLRTRLLLQIGRREEALETIGDEPKISAFPSWIAEHAATRSLALACLGERESALRAVSTARDLSKCLEIEILVLATLAILDLRTEARDSIGRLFAVADRYAIWDPVVCALRAEPTLVSLASELRQPRRLMTDLVHRSGDTTLARQMGIRQLSRRAPAELLSRREYEVLGLMSRGLRNKEIAAALYVAESTVKVHVRHILERLGVRTRAEAVARYERLTPGS